MPEVLQKLYQLGPYLGLDLTTDSDKLQPGFAADMNNIVPFRTYGQYVAAKGRTAGLYAGTFGVGANNFGLFLSGANVAALISQQDGVIRTGSLGVGATASVLTMPGATWSANRKIRVKSYDGNLYVTNGGQGSTDLPIRVNQATPTSAQYWGIAPPLNMTNASGQLLTRVPNYGLQGYYYWCYTYKNSVTGQESSHSPIFGPSVLLGVGSNPAYNAAYLQTPVSGSLEPGVDTINFYRLGGTLQTWTLVASQPIVGGNAAFQDWVSDSFLTGQNLVLHRDPPPNFRSTCVHKERMWGFGYDQPYPYSFSVTNAYVSIPAAPANLWYSRYGEPWAFDCVNAVLPIGKNTVGDTAVGLASTGSVLVCFKRFSYFVVFGDSDQDFRPVPGGSIGAYSQDAIGEGYGYVWWLSPDGNIWQFDGQALDNISEGSTDLGGIKTALDALNGNFAGINFAVYNRVLYVNFGYSGPTYLYYLKTRTWWKYSYGSRWIASLPQQPYFAGISPGTSGNLDSWEQHDGDAYISPYFQSWLSGVTDFGYPTSRKSLRYIILKIPPGDILNTLKVTFFIDGNLLSNVPILNPRARSVGNQGVGGWYYRISLPGGFDGYSFEIQIVTTQNSTVPMRISDIQIYGSVTDNFQLNTTVAGGSV